MNDLEKLRYVEALVGAPYEKINCWSLITRAYSARHITLPADYGQMLLQFNVVSEPAPWDLIPMHLQSELVPNHVGLVLDARRFIHSVEGYGVIVTDLDDPAWVRRFAKRKNGERGFLRWNG